MPSTRTRRPVAVLACCLALLLAGCLGGPTGTGGQTPLGTDESTVTNTSEPVDLQYGGDYLAANDSAWSEKAAVDYGNDSGVVVTGRISGIGDRPCLLMDATATRSPNGTLLVTVETDFEAPEEKSGCNATATLYEYRATVDVDRPERVVVRHGDGPGTAFGTLDGSVRELASTANRSEGSET